ncbi:hypothetical protein N0V90_011212 [Kalmusia sp. IMI 367209]|nr:hypothetical protein N0V90_011212 [Kalmusia sp. IMI 367209]
MILEQLRAQILTTLGPVIRVSPNELSFASLTSFKTIYGHPPSGQTIPTKDEFYDMYGAAHKEGCIGSERDPQKHNRMKRSLAGSFSTRALVEQEPTINKCVDEFITKIRSMPLVDTKGLDMTHWFEMVAFDILGEMAFGESFGAVESGGETIATELTGIIYYLLTVPRTHAKLAQEIRDAFTSYSAISATAAQRLPYLQAVIEEGLRIYPSGALGFPRKSPGIRIDGYWIPSGVEIYTSSWTTHHDPQYFHDPDTFKPERWLSESSDIKEASQPFSLGPRGCLGRNFAYAEMSLILAKMLWTYDVELVNVDINLPGQGRMHVMWWKPPMYIRFRPKLAL